MGVRVNGKGGDVDWGHTLMILVNVAVNPRPRISPRIPLCPSQNDLLTNALNPSIVSKGQHPPMGPQP